MTENTKTMVFELSPQQIKYRDLLNKEFLELEMWIISDVDPNRNRTHFTLEGMKDAQEGMHNKPILGFFNKGDFESHNGKAEWDDEYSKQFWNTENGERILGLIRESDPIEIVEKNGLNWVKIKCALWINYCYKQVKRLLKDKNKKVSVEITVLDSEQREDGIEEIKKFVLNGVTILGSRNGKPVLEGIPDAHLSLIDVMIDEAFEEQRSVLSFAYEQADANIQNFSEKEEYTGTKDVRYQSDATDANKTNSEERYSEGEAIKVDKSRDAMSNRAWGSVDKTALRNRVAAASNFKTIAKSIFLDLREGWEDGEVSKLKYPVMCIEDGTAVYNRGALASATAYAEKNNERKILAKLKKIYKYLGLNKEDFASEDILSETDIDLMYTYEVTVSNLMEETEKTKVEQEAAEETCAEKCAAEEPKTEECSCEGCASSDTQGDSEEPKSEECAACGEANTCEADSEKCDCGECDDDDHDDDDHDDDDGEEKCPECGESMAKCKCEAKKCEAEEEKPEEDAVCGDQELEACKARCAELEQKCEALQCSCNELNEKCAKYEADYADYAEVKSRMEKAESKLFEIYCNEMKNFAVSKMANERINDADRTAITQKASEGLYESEQAITNDIAIAIYNARPAQAERFSAEFPAKEETKPNKKNMTAREKLAAYTK